MLEALQEPSLWLSASSANEAYRFLWLRTDHHPISVRLEVLANGTGAVTTKISDGRGGYAPGNLTENKNTILTKDQVNSFLGRVNLDKFWSLPSEGKADGLDGSEWIVEAKRKGRYHIVSRWTPTKGPIHDLGVALVIELAKIDIPEQEFY